MKKIQKTILVVDDDANSRLMLTRMLGAIGYGLLNAASGQEVFEALERFHADGILLDMMMPDMNGNQVAAKLRSDPSTSKIPIIMLTASINPKVKNEAFACGVDAFLTKPIGISELQTAIDFILGQREKPAVWMELQGELL
jgi:two-component system cell cycle response regulator